MPALLSPLFGWGFGVLFALLPGLAPRRKGDELADRGLVLAFAMGVYAPACGWLLAVAGDWSYAYTVDAAKVPSALELLLTLLDAAAVVGGHRAARELLPRAPGAPTWALLLAPVLVGTLSGLALGTRLGLETTSQRFQSGYGSEPLGSGPLGPTLLWTAAVALAGLVVCGAALRSRRWRREPVARTSPGGAWLGARKGG